MADTERTRLGLGLQRESQDPWYTAPDGTRYLINGASINVDPAQFSNPVNRFMDQATWDRIRNDPTLMITTPDGKQAFREDLMMEIARTLPSSGINNDSNTQAILSFLSTAVAPWVMGVLNPGMFPTAGTDIFPIGADTLGTIGGTSGFTGFPGVTDVPGLPEVPPGWDLPDFPVPPETPGVPNTPGLPEVPPGPPTTPNTPNTPGLPEIPKVPPMPPSVPGDDLPTVPDGWDLPDVNETPGDMGLNGTEGWLKRILNGVAKDSDWLKLLAAGGGSVLDYFGDQASGDQAMDLWNAVQNSPGMTRFNNSFAPGWSIMDADPSFQGALDASANAFTRAASARVGNVGGNPGAWNEIQTNVMNSTLAPWTTNYRAQNLNAAGIAANSVQPFAPSIINSAGSGWDNAGSFLGYLSGQNQQNQFGMSNDGKSITFNGKTYSL